jgi:predicted P-loop ATPase
MIISTGRDRFSKRPSQEKYSWEQLVKKFSDPIVTIETFAEYVKSNKDKKLQIKDRGWFIGGLLQVQSTARRGNKIKLRSLVTLDIEDCDLSIFSIIDRMMSTYGFCGLLHSSHSHAKNDPHLRLILPFETGFEPISNDEYEYIARKVACLIGIENVCRTTFQATRVMFWPSKSRDGEWVFKSWEGMLLQKGMFLRDGWTDRSKWPLHPLEKDIKKIVGRKQQDPTTKSGPIGAFCRTYPLERLFTEILLDKDKNPLYEESNVEGRYTYTLGSTSCGAVIYDTHFLYSWHGTDPASERLSNAFDLVRLHMFEGSENKALKYIVSLPEVREELSKEDFSEAQPWHKELARDRNGNIYKTYKNIELILKNEFNIKFNEFDKKIYIQNKGQWYKSSKRGLLQNIDITMMHRALQTKYNVHTSKQLVEDSVDIVANLNTYHPIKRYLDGLTWDGTRRVDSLLTNSFGTPNDSYHRDIIRKFLLAAIYRIYDSPIKFDHVLTPVGKTGYGKSSFFKILFGKSYFTDSLSLNEMKDKTGAEKLPGKWCIELAEIAGMYRTDNEVVKSFLTRESDYYRPPYARVLEDMDRTSVIAATTNESDTGFLKDLTGNRRWWPFLTKCKVDHEWLYSIRNQVWAEAKQIYDTGGEELYLTDYDSIKESIRIQNSLIAVDDNVDYVANYLEMPVPGDWYKYELHQRRAYIKSYMAGSVNKDMLKEYTVRKYITIAEIWGELFKKEIEDKKLVDSRNIRAMLLSMNYDLEENKKIDTLWGRQKAYKKI